MIGKAVPFVLVPRYTSYVGAGAFTTAALRVSDYTKAHVTFWRGILVGSALGNGFLADFEESHDQEQWVNAATRITTVNRSENYDITLSRRWFRLKIELTAGGDPKVGITCWASGLLERRIGREASA